MKVYAGSPAGARCYVEADRGRADDYYLAEGSGLARRYTAGDGRVVELAPLAGEGYEAWVGGLDPDTGVARGRLRSDGNAVRFVEVVVNGPKSWSLAAALHEDVAAAYDAAQDRAAERIVGWLAAHATTRVGPRGGQVQVPVETLEAVTVAHRTSRAGDPHRHLHLQVNARVLAAGGGWRGLHTVGVRDSLTALNGIGHAAVACDPVFRGALAAHGYTLGPAGEIRQLAGYVGAFSARARQIGRNIDRYEADWRVAHPGETPGPSLRRSWDRRAWADGRPDKITPQPGEELTARWLAELTAVGYREPDRPVVLAPTPVGVLDRERAAADVLDRLGAARSAWNPADIRGQVEVLIAEAGIVSDVGVRGELAEDLTTRALHRCVRLLDRGGVPEHVRAWTSPAVLDVEAELVERLVRRATADAGLDEPVDPRIEGVTPPPVGMTSVNRGVTPLDVPVPPLQPAIIQDPFGLDAGQAAVAAVLADRGRALMVVEGAAGAGKTATLHAAREAVRLFGHEMVVVTPSLKAARVAADQTGAVAGSAAWLAYQHGWRWTDDGPWSRLAVGDADPRTGRTYAGPEQAARLRPGDLLVVDEAGMCDQDTARALLVVADECQVRVALVGDRHQLAAVGRGGVLDLAADKVDPGAHLTLDTVHRFVTPSPDDTSPVVTIPDVEYADLTLAMRTATDPGAVFDALLARGQVRLYADAGALQTTVARLAADGYAQGQRIANIVDTREQAAELNAAIRERLADAFRVDDLVVVTTRAGQRIGMGDRVATRRNDRDLGVANRDTWRVVSVERDDSLLVAPDLSGTDTAARGVVRSLPADYVAEHVELAYASTVHGVQGDTVTTAHLVVGEHTGAASAYVGMTRGREHNTAHLVADSVDDAREAWITVFARDKADLGPAKAAEQADLEVARYGPDVAPAFAPASPAADGERLEAVLGELFAAWTEQEDAHYWQRNSEHRLATTEAHATWYEHSQQILRPLEDRYQIARGAKERAEHAAAGSADVLAEATRRIAEQLRRQWDAQLREAREWARVVAAGPGRLGVHRGRVADATMRLDVWAYTWTDAFPGPHPDLEKVRGYPAGYASGVPAVNTALYQHAGHLAAAEHPEQAALLRGAEQAHAAYDTAASAYFGAQRDLREQSSLPTYDTGAAASLLGQRAKTLAAQQRAETADEQVARLRADPAISSQPDPAGVLAAAGDRWARQRETELASRLFAHRAERPASHPPAPEEDLPYQHSLDVSRGPSIGR
ncbi:MAG TPA: MobF family relaxase [Mycobacteriales bacterium]